MLSVLAGSSLSVQAQIPECRRTWDKNPKNAITGTLFGANARARLNPGARAIHGVFVRQEAALLLMADRARGAAPVWLGARIPDRAWEE